MCGIAGIVDLTGQRDISSSLIHAMNETQFHRGPDEGGVWQDAGVALAHRRLSIIDLSTGQQPMSSADGGLVLVYNGEIYNFPELRAELELHGHVFSTNSDTEVVLYSWKQWGVDCVDRFRGMFAFALWDKREQSLFLARDRLGIKPLHYSMLPNGQLIFGSELKAVMHHPEVRREKSPQAVEQYLHYGYVPDPKTIYEHVHKLAPGHRILLQRGKPVPKPQQYWDVPFEPLPAASGDELQEELVERIREAVKIRMVAEVPLGAFLSGGVDSSAVVAMMAGLSDEPVNTCSIGFKEAAFDESDYADDVAKQYKTSHEMRRVESDDFDLIDDLARLYDEPYADSSSIPTYRVCQLAREKVTVALSGDGGDEGMAGYRRYRLHMMEERVRSKIPLSVRRGLFGPLGTAYPKLDWAPRVFRGKTTFQAMARSSAEAYAHSMTWLSEDLRELLYTDEFKRELQGYHAREVLVEHAAAAPTDDPLSLIQYLDFKTYLPGDILTKVDRASMAHSLEVRVPLLDHQLVEWLSGLPGQQKLSGGEGKLVFKQAMEPYLPNKILYRPKMGFAIPLCDWFRGPLRERMYQALQGPALLDMGIFKPRMLTKIADDHVSGRRDYSAAIWALMMLASHEQLA